MYMKNKKALPKILLYIFSAFQLSKEKKKKTLQGIVHNKTQRSKTKSPIKSQLMQDQALYLALLSLIS